MRRRRHEPPRIFLTRRWPAAVEEALQQHYRVTANPQDRPLPQTELLEAMRSHDALCPTVTDVIDAALLEAAGTSVSIIANYGVGYQHVDVEACRRAGIVLTNTPGVLTDATADLALTLMLMTARRAGEGERLVRSGTWPGLAPTQLLGTELRGRTLGLIGFGRIGRAFAARAFHGLGMRICYSAPRRASSADELAVGAEFVATLADLLQRADVVSLHCPGGSATRHLIDAQRLRTMKATAILINTSRGTVVDEQALAHALAEGHIAAAGLDVYEAEPQVPSALRALENVVLLPHLGSATAATRIAMGMRVADNLAAFFSGATPPDRVA